MARLFVLGRWTIAESNINNERIPNRLSVEPSDRVESLVEKPLNRDFGGNRWATVRRVQRLEMCDNTSYVIPDVSELLFLL